jgi:predicted ribosomally synthesized peptide with SipW-like signal peptide
MLKTINTKVLLSGATVLAAAALIIGGTFAFFSDTETSTGNVLEAGAIDLKVDSEAHYAGLVCQNNLWVDENPPSTTRQDLVGKECAGTWSLKDLGQGDMFFNLDDIKPGDEGENTISLHVFTNDAWGQFVISNVQDLDNDCTEPETEVIASLDPECGAPTPTPNQPSPSGELADSLSFHAWIDQGAILGFQCFNPVTGSPGARCAEDPTEGDNIQQCVSQQVCQEPDIITPGPLDVGGETHNIWQGLGLYRASLGTACDATDLDGDGHAVNGTGQYLACHGLADDGRLVGSATYYFGLAWSLPDSVGNEAQTDSLSADLSFKAVQQRNNPNQIF